jgi:hypothetical protein
VKNKEKGGVKGTKRRNKRNVTQRKKGSFFACHLAYAVPFTP